VDDLHLARAITEAPLVFETVTDEGHELRIDLNGVEAVAGKEAAEDFLGDGAGAGADFEDASGGPAFAQLKGQRSGEKRTAGQNRARVPEVTPTFAEKVSAFRPVPQPSRPRRLALPGDRPRWCDCNLLFLDKGAIRKRGTTRPSGDRMRLHFLPECILDRNGIVNATRWKGKDQVAAFGSAGG